MSVETPLGLAAVTLAAYAATSFDNLVLLVAFVSREGKPIGSVLRGALLSASVMLGLCLSAALLADFAPQRWIGYLGIVPIVMGIRELSRRYRKDRPTQQSASSGTNEAAPRDTAQAVSAREVAVVMLANSADSSAALIPIFAETRNALLPLVSGILLVASASACVLANAIASNPHLGPPIQRVGSRLVPYVLIGVGLYVVWNTGSDTAL